MAETGESKKKGFATTIAMGVLAYHPTTWMELTVCGMVIALAVYYIRWQGTLDKEKKFKKLLDETS